MVENNVNMDKFEKRAVIKYLLLEGMCGKAIHDDMLSTLVDNAPAYSVVKSYRFSCMIASAALFDSRGGFWGQAIQ